MVGTKRHDAGFVGPNTRPFPSPVAAVGVPGRVLPVQSTDCYLKVNAAGWFSAGVLLLRVLACPAGEERKLGIVGAGA